MGRSSTYTLTVPVQAGSDGAPDTAVEELHPEAPGFDFTKPNDLTGATLPQVFGHEFSGKGVDVAFDAAGVGAAVHQGIASLTPQGTLLVVALHEQEFGFNPTPSSSRRTRWSAASPTDRRTSTP
jgi:NADPH:quinone reductase-like Zn-dependent oxidoreductase